MSPYFVCHECSNVIHTDQAIKKCPYCPSANGHMITDDEFREDKAAGVIKTINPRTGKPFKKGK